MDMILSQGPGTFRILSQVPGSLRKKHQTMEDAAKLMKIMNIEKIAAHSLIPLCRSLSIPKTPDLKSHEKHTYIFCEFDESGSAAVDGNGRI